MKPVFTEEVANELGYQKFYPEWKDWVLGTACAFTVLIIFGAFLFLIIKLSA